MIYRNSDMTDIFIAEYKKIPIAVSTDKNIVKDYMKNNRGLSKNEYTLYKETVDSLYYHTQYENEILCKFHNLYIPSIDISIIEMEYLGISKEFGGLIDQLKYFAFLFNRINDKKILNQFIVLIKSLEKVLNKGKRMRKIEKVHQLNHPVLQCDMNRYFAFVDMYKEYKQMSERYKELCNSD